MSWRVQNQNLSTKRENGSFLLGRGRTRIHLNTPIHRSDPWVDVVKREYESWGLDKWDNAKVHRVCRMFRCTLKELCAVAGLFNKSTVMAYQAENYWPMYLTIQWDRMVRFKLGLPGIHVQDAMAAKHLSWKNEEEKAA